MTSPHELWDGVLRRLGSDVPAFALAAWLRPLALEVEGDGARLLCPTPFHRDRVRVRFLAQIARALALEAGRALGVSLAVADSASRRAPAPAARPACERRAAPAEQRARGVRAQPRRRAARAARAPLHVRHVRRRALQRARARSGARARARRQQSLNPLFLVGGSRPRQDPPRARDRRRGAARGSQRAVYASAEGFTSEFMTAIRAQRMEPFKRRFRQGCQLLVIEDVQFLGAKTATQLELFHTLVHLLDVGRARRADRPTACRGDIDGFDPRLRSQHGARAGGRARGARRRACAADPAREGGGRRRAAVPTRASSGSSRRCAAACATSRAC